MKKLLKSHKNQRTKQVVIESAALYSCDLCDALFRNEDALLLHVKDSHDFQCQLCRESFPSKSTFQEHIGTDHRVLTDGQDNAEIITEVPVSALGESSEDWNCVFCGENFHDKREYDKHNRLCKSAEEEKVTKEERTEPLHQICEVCGKEFTSNLALLDHLRREHEKCLDSKATLPCPECGERFHFKTSLDNHLALKHEVKNSFHDKIRCCKICGIITTNESHFKSHMAKHSNGARFSCSTCGKKFKHQSSRDKHSQVVHSNTREYQCHICQKEFATKSYLDQHLNNVHSEAANLKCPHCPQDSKVFKTRRTYEAHQRTCHDESSRKYVCELCGHRFLSPKDLRRHSSTVHAKAKLFQCSLCTKTFSRKDNYNVHLQLHKNKEERKKEEDAKKSPEKVYPSKNVPILPKPEPNNSLLFPANEIVLLVEPIQVEDANQQFLLDPSQFSNGFDL